MDTRVRNILLMEQDGFDCSAQARELSRDLRDSSLYKNSLERLKLASETCPTPSVIAAYTECRDLKFEISTMREYSQLETQVFIAGVRALPQWWTNPFNPTRETSGGISSVGQLFADDTGERTIDDVLTDQRMAVPDKVSLLTDRVNRWHRDMTYRTSEVMSGFREASSRDSGARGISFYLQLVVLFAANIFCLVLMLLPYEAIIEAFYRPTLSSIQTYVVYVPMIATAIYDVLYIVYTIVFLRRNRVADYASKFSREKSKSYLNNLDQAALRLVKDLTSAAESCISMPANCLSSYSSALGEELDMEALSEEQRRKAKHPHGFLRALYLFSLWLCVFAVIFAILALVLIYVGGFFA